MPVLVSRIVCIGALMLMAGCGNPETGTFSAASSEKAAAEKGITGPGPGANKTPVKPTVVKTKKGVFPRVPGGGAPSPE
jgi:hypothetical protein